eukprot:gene15878-22372_t
MNQMHDGSRQMNTTYTSSHLDPSKGDFSYANDHAN